MKGLEEEVTLLKSKLDNMIKFVRMLNNDSYMLLEILDIWENIVIGFDYSSINKRVKIPNKKFVASENKTEFLMKDHMSRRPD